MNLKGTHHRATSYAITSAIALGLMSLVGLNASNIFSANTVDADDLTNPTDITATALCVNNSSTVRVTWSGGSGNPTYYNVLRDGSVITTVSGNSFDDNNVSPGVGYVYNVQACDSSGCASGQSQSAAATAIVCTPQNQPPTCNAVSANPSSGDYPITLSFTANASDPDGDTLEYSWNYGDGAVVTNNQASTQHEYTTNGNFTVAVTVRDGNGGVDVCDTQVVITAPNQDPVCNGISANPTSGPIPLTVFFTANASDPDGNSLSYSWNFGDGGSGTGTNPNHIYTAIGNYSVVATVSDGSGGSTTCNTTINAGSDLTNPTDIAATALCVDNISTVHVTWNGGTGNPTHYLVLRDGVQIAQVNSQSYDDTNVIPGVGYTYNVRACDANGCASGQSQTAAATAVNCAPNNNPPVCIGVTASPSSGEAPLFVNFSANASDPDGDSLTYTWNYDDGTVITNGANTTHTFNSAGEYNVAVTARDGNGGVDVCGVTVIVGEQHDPICHSLTANPNSGSPPLNVNFSTNATDPDGDPLTYGYDFGDGQTISNGANTSHTYSSDGTYTASVTVFDGNGGSDTCTTTITVGTDLTNPTEIAATALCVNDISTIRVTWSGATGTPTYYIVYRDGVEIAQVTGQSYNDTNVIPGVGYTYSVRACDANGCASGQSPTAAATAVDCAPNNNPPICSSVSASPSSGEAPLFVNFTANASDPDGDSLTYTWNYGDGTIINNGANTSHTFNTTGTYSISVTVRDGNGGVDICGTTVVVTTDNGPTCHNLTANPSTGPAPLYVSFSTNASHPDNETLSYNWNYGDGNTGTYGPNTNHTYTADGTYLINVTVTDQGGDSDICQATVVVETVNHAPLCSRVTADPSNGEAPLNVNFVATATDSDGDTLTYDWDYGDGTTLSNGANTSHTFTSIGQFLTVVTVTDTHGASTTCSTTVTVRPPNNQPICSNVTVNPTTGAIGTPITFTANASDPDGDTLLYGWDISDGTIGLTGQMITHAFSAIGTYTATATVSDGNGGTTTCQGSVVISEPPNNPPVCSSASVSPSTGVIGTNFGFSAAASDPDGDILTYTWNFGDGSSGNGSSVSHAYSSTGTYTAVATVTDPSGESDTCQATVVIQGDGNQAPTCSGVTASPSSGITPLSVNFTASASDPDGDTLSYDWNFGDGNTSLNIGSSASNTYTSVGNYTTVVTISDGNGGTATCQTTVNVSNETNQNPVCTGVTANPASGNAPLSTTLTASATDPDGDTLSYSWNFGDNQSGSGNPVSHTYAAGNYTAIATITDGNGGSTTCQASINSTTGTTTFTIDKDVSPDNADDEDDVTYTIIIRNTGSIAGNVTLTDTIGRSGRGYLSGSDGGRITLIDSTESISGASNSGSIGDDGGIVFTNVPAGGSITVRYRAEVDADSIDAGSTSRFENRACLSTGPCDDADVRVESEEGDLTIEKRTTPTTLRDGETATTVITIRNDSIAEVDSVDVVDTISGSGIVVGSNGGWMRYVNNSMTVSGSDYRGSIESPAGVELRNISGNTTVTIRYRMIAVANGINSGSSSTATNTAILSSGGRSSSTVTILGPNSPNTTVTRTYTSYTPPPTTVIQVAPPPRQPQNGPMEVLGIIFGAITMGGGGTWAMRKKLLPILLKK